jgi:hypothetical protein
VSFIGFGGGAGGLGGASGRFGSTRGRIQGGSQVQGVNYPSPFFDVAHTYLPVTVKQLFKWCRYYFMTNPLINATVFKLSEYPVTDIIIDHESPEVKRKWTEYFQDHLKYRAFQIECGLDYHAYGNTCVSLGFPFKKYLYCRGCQFRDEAAKIRDAWIFTSFQFRLSCPKCGFIGDAKVQDFYYKNASGIKTIRWNPEDIEITYNDITGEYAYYYTIPPVVRNDIVIGRKDVVEGIPQVFIQAMRESKGVIFSKDNFFHMRRPTLATQDRGWGTPLLLPVLKDTFYLQVMKKAQEAVLLEHIVPLRILFPQAGSGSSDPYTTINLVDWRDQIAAEIARWRYDNNYIPILPLPIGNQSIGGDGKALMLTQEIQAWSEQIMVGMGVPREFLMGGMSYSGTNVSMRMMENMFIGYLLRHQALARFVMKQVAAFLGWPEAHIRFKPFKMADDLQRKAYLFQLNQANKVSDTTLLADSDLSQEEENAIMLRETSSRTVAAEKQQLAMAEIQGKVQGVMMKYQAKGQEIMQKAQAAPAAPGEPGGPEAQLGGGAPGATGGAGGAMPAEMQAAPMNDNAMGAAPALPPPASGSQTPQDFLSSVTSSLSGQQRMGPGSTNVDLPSLAMAQAKTLVTLPPAQQEIALQNLQLQSPDLADLVRQYLSTLTPPTGAGGGGGGQGNTGSMVAGVDTRPAPEQRPARRAGG